MFAQDTERRRQQGGRGRRHNPGQPVPVPVRNAREAANVGGPETPLPPLTAADYGWPA